MRADRRRGENTVVYNLTRQGDRERERERGTLTPLLQLKIYSTFSGCESRTLGILEESSLWNDIDSG